ncbi:transcriptional regulator, TetR family [Glycomyces sambucus]|uniref:Transcriptional regulator, TetR family n=1 Tax=Glycomyces sambucus TaxID=380244 RepID=A0A1G9FXX8_9ACTN|nr:TetR/AcrR family transcriptional regulator [Glycomyces sambucus]SDK93250.1 transcriptional regulator, TetR family [Glycomyces sambucus]
MSDASSGDQRARAGSQRSPSPEARVRDPDRSRARLLAAALDEFAAKGYAGARVTDIADRAGVNRQLITYYFGGKRGLYRALGEQWIDEESDMAPPSLPLPDMAAAHLEAILADPRHSRLLLWESLTGSDEDFDGTGGDDEDPATADLRRRQGEGELGEEFDAGMVLVALMGAALAPVAIPQVVRRSTGLDPDDPAFAERFAEQLRRLVRRLAGPAPKDVGGHGA